MIVTDSCSESHRRYRSVAGFKFKRKLRELNRRQGCSQDEGTERKPINRTTDTFDHFRKFMIDKFPNFLYAFAPHLATGHSP